MDSLTDQLAFISHLKSIVAKRHFHEAGNKDFDAKASEREHSLITSIQATIQRAKDLEDVSNHMKNLAPAAGKQHRISPEVATIK